MSGRKLRREKSVRIPVLLKSPHSVRLQKVHTVVVLEGMEGILWLKRIADSNWQ